jgi:hypothetical protein
MKPTKLSIGILALWLGYFSPAGAQTFLTNGLVGWYPFTDGNANDQSGNLNNTIVTGANPANDRFGWPSNAYVFSNVGDSISATNSNGFPVGTNDFTVSVWVNVSSNISAGNVLIRNQVIGQFDVVVSVVFDGNARVFFNTGGGGVSTPQIPWALQKWYNLQVVRSQNTNITIFRDGVQLSHQTTTLGNAAPPSSRNLTFGSQAGGTGVIQFYGLLDDIRIYNRALSPTELQQLYQNEAGPRSGLVKAVKPIFDNLSFGTNYQLQISSDLDVWTNSGLPFTATNRTMVYQQYWDVHDWNGLFFRLQVVP